MSKKDKVYMPMGSGGLLRYEEEEKTDLIKLKPQHVVWIVVGLCAAELIAKVVF